MVLSLSHVAQMLDEVHDVRSIIHGVLWKQISVATKRRIQEKAYTFELLQNTRVQVFVHVPILQSIMGGFLGGVDRCIEMLQLRCKPHADLEGIRHDLTQ